MVDNQHRQIPGYRDLDQNTIDTIRAIKMQEDTMVSFWNQVKETCPEADGRDLALARTHFEDAFIRLVRAVARPDSPWNRNTP